MWRRHEVDPCTVVPLVVGPGKFPRAAFAVNLDNSDTVVRRAVAMVRAVETSSALGKETQTA